MVGLTPIEVKFQDMSLELMRSILNRWNHPYVGSIMELMHLGQGNQFTFINDQTITRVGLDFEKKKGYN